MNAIRRTDNSRVSGLVKIVQLGGEHADVEPIGLPGRVLNDTGGAEVRGVVGVILHTLHHPDLLG